LCNTKCCNYIGNIAQQLSCGFNHVTSLSTEHLFLKTVNTNMMLILIVIINLIISFYEN
jgi:hypothetical protein